MAWTLEIHHIDVGQGDATLIVARNPLAEIPVRSCLIDGGLGNKASIIHNYITTTAKLELLNVMVATHYDKDHIGGLIRLLSMEDSAYKSTTIFDQGYPGTYSTKRTRDNEWNIYPNDDVDNLYHHYTGAIDKFNTRNRITEYVSTNSPVSYLKPQEWLVGKEILMWENFTQQNKEWSYSKRVLDDAPPTITCIAANQYIQTPSGIQGPFGGGGTDPKNEKSLAFLVQFNNFKYYIGGDLTSAQEDEGMQNFLNPNNDPEGRVHAIKCSHHGSGESTSRNFVDTLKPLAAFISCGADNVFGSNSHPDQKIINRLEGFNSNDYSYNTENPHPVPNYANPVGNFQIPAENPPNHSVENYYMTSPGGYHHSYLGSGADVVAGNNEAEPKIPGDIKISISNSQSKGNELQEGQNAQFTVQYIDSEYRINSHP